MATKGAAVVPGDHLVKVLFPETCGCKPVIYCYHLLTYLSYQISYTFSQGPEMVRMGSTLTLHLIH